MKVLHVIRSLDPAEGGPPVIVQGLTQAQAELGIWPRIAAYGSSARVPFRTEPEVPILELRRLPRWMELVCVPDRSRLKEAIREADIVHLHGVWDPILVQAGACARRAGKPYVLTAHGMLDSWSLSQRWLRKRVAMATTHRRLLREVSCFVVHPHEVESLRRLGLSGRIETITNGVDERTFSELPGRGTFRGRYSAIGERPFVLFLSRLHYKKGLDYLAEAFAEVAQRHGEVQLVVAGPDEGERGRFERWIAQEGLRERVHVVGPLYGQEKLAALVDAVCFVLPSRQEGFSMAIIEALACGCPVVISRECNFPQAAERGCGFVLPLEAKAFAQAMMDLLADPDRARRMGKAGRELVFEQYTWSKIARRMVEIYRSICEEGKG